jgi:hypothetical protein
MPADREAADRRAEQTADHSAGEDRQRRRSAEQLHQDGRGIGAGAEERGMAEGQYAGEAEQQVVGAGEQREADDPGQENRIEMEGRETGGEQREAGEEDAHRSATGGRRGRWG